MLKLAKNLELPPEIAGRRTAIFGISGSGKSNTATVIIEGLLDAGEQVVLIDPKGEGWGLLSLQNGKPSNLDIIAFGEPNGHIMPLNENHGEHIADFVVESGRSVVLSLLGFESDASERRFVAKFLRQLYRRKSQQGRPTRTLVVLDEAHLFVPESAGRGFQGPAAELAGACQRIVRQGRSFGIGALIIDQRPQDVAKRVISQCDTLICHQLVHKTDRDALRDWVRGYDRDGSGEQFLESVAALEPGDAWVWSPAWLKIFQKVHANIRRTFDSGAAPDGSAASKTVQRADIDIDALRGQLDAVVEEAKANDPKNLQKEIAQLKKDLKQAQSAKPTLSEKEVPVIPEKAIEKLTDEIAGFRKEYVAKLDVIARGFQNLNGTKHVDRIEAGLRDVLGGIKLPTVPRPQIVKSARPMVQVVGDLSLSKAERLVLQAFYWIREDRNITAAKIGFYSGYSHKSGGFANTLSGLRSKGLLIGYQITSEGEALASTYAEARPSGTELREWLRPKLSKCENEILDVLVANPGVRFDNETLAQNTVTQYSHSSGGFANALSRLRSLEAAEGYGREGLKAADVFFE